MISSYFRLPFGCWAHCHFPAVTDGFSFVGRIVNGNDFLVWIGRLQLVVARSKRSGQGAKAAPADFEGSAAAGSPPTERLYRTLRSALAHRR